MYNNKFITVRQFRGLLVCHKWLRTRSTEFNFNTVLPLLNGPSDGRPPGINGQFLCALTCFPNKWPLTGGHPRDAASGQQICAEKPLVTSDGRPVHVANVLLNI